MISTDELIYIDGSEPGQGMVGSVCPGTGSGGLSFVPIMGSYFGRGAFLNISGSHTIGDFVRSIYEGVAYINKKNFDVYGSLGLGIKKITMIGGGVNSSVWPDITADV